MRAIIRIIDPAVGRAVEFPQVAVTRAALDAELWRLRASGAEIFGAPCYGYIVWEGGRS